MEEFYYPSEIARLVLGYLDDVKCENSWHIFIEECEDLQEHCRLYKLGRIYSTNVRGESLLDILTSYCALKSFFDQIICQNSWKSFLKDILYLQEHYCAYKKERVCSSNINGKAIVDVLKKWALKITDKSNSCPSCSSNINRINFLCPDSVSSEKSSVDHHSVQIQTSDANCQNTVDSTTQTEKLTCHPLNSSEDQLQQITETDALCSHNNDPHASPTTSTNVQNEERASNAAQLLNESPVVEKQVVEASINHDFVKDQSSQLSRFQISPLQTPDKDEQNRMEEDCVHDENEQESSNANQFFKKQISELSKNSPSHGGLFRDRPYMLSYFTPKKSKRNLTEIEKTSLRKCLAQIQENLNESPLSKDIELAETPFKLDPVGNKVLDDVKNSPEYNALWNLISASKVSREPNFLTSPDIHIMNTDDCSDDEADHVNETADVEAPFNDDDNGLNLPVETVDLCKEMSEPNPSAERNDSTAAILNKESNSNHELPLENHSKTENTLQSANFNEENCVGREKLDQNVNEICNSQTVSHSDEPDTWINVAQVCASKLIVQNSSNSNVANESENLELHTEKNVEEQTALSDNIGANLDNLSVYLAENSASKGSDKNVLCNSNSIFLQEELPVALDSQSHAAPHDSTTSLNNNCDKTVKTLPQQNISVNVSQQPVSQSNNSTSIAKTSDSQGVTLPVIIQPNQASAIFSYPSTFVMPNPVDPTNNIQYRLILNTLNAPMTWNTSGLGNLCIPTQSVSASSVLNQRLIAPATNVVKNVNTGNSSRNVSSGKATNPVPSRKKAGNSCDQNVNIRLPNKSPLKSRNEHLSVSSDDFSHNPNIPILLPDKTPIKNNNRPSTIASNEPTCSSSVNAPPVTKSPPKKIERERSLSPRSSIRRARDHWRMVTATEKSKQCTKAKKKPVTIKSSKSKAEKKGNSPKRRRSYALRSKKKSTTSPSKKSSASPSNKSKKTPTKSPKQDIPVLSIPESTAFVAKYSATENILNQFEKEFQSPVSKMLVPQGATISVDGNVSNAFPVRSLNFGSKPTENTNVRQKNAKKKKKTTKDKTVAESLGKKHAKKKKKKIESSSHSDLKISEKKKKKKSKKCPGTTLEKNSDSVTKSIDTISVECVTLNNETCAKTQHESDRQIKDKNDAPDFIAVEEHNVNIDVEKSNTKVTVEDSVVQNNADENNSKTVASTECIVPNERTVSNIEIAQESITRIMHSKQKKECKKIGSPRMSKKESPKNLQKAQNKRKMRPPKKRVKSDNLELSVIDTLAFNLNSDKSSGSKLGEVKITPASVLPLVHPGAFQNSHGDTEEVDVEIVDLCEEDNIGSAPSCSMTKTKPQSPSAVHNRDFQQITENAVHCQKHTQSLASNLSTVNKLQKMSPEKSHQLDSSFDSAHQEQPSTPSYLPITKSYLAQANKEPSKKTDVELPIYCANSTHHTHLPPDSAMSENSKISAKNPDLNEKNISSQCRTENKTSDPEMAISKEQSISQSSCSLKNTFTWNKVWPLKKRFRPPISLGISPFKRFNISETALQKQKERRAMKVSHSESLNIKQSDPSNKISTMDKDKSASSSNFASSSETDCFQLSNTTLIPNKPDKFTKSAESNDQIRCENIIEKSAAGETEGISENECVNEMPVDMDGSFCVKKRKLSVSSCELQIVLNESIASSVDSSPQKRKEAVSQNALPEDNGPSSLLQSSNLNVIAEDNITEDACNAESNLNLNKLQDSPVRCISKKAVHKSALSKKVEKDPSIPAGVKIPSKWNNSIIKTYSWAIREPVVGDKKIGKGKKQMDKKRKPPVDASITETFKSVKMKLNDGKQGVSKKLFPETVEENNACNDNKLSDSIIADKKINNACVRLTKMSPKQYLKALNCDEIENAMLSGHSNDNFQQTSNETVLNRKVQGTLNKKVTGATWKPHIVKMIVADDSEIFKDTVESDIGMSTEKESELATASAACETERHGMQYNQCSPSPKKNDHAQKSSVESENPASTGLSFSSEEEKLAYILRLTKEIGDEKLWNYLK